MNQAKRHSPEVRERAARLLLDLAARHYHRTMASQSDFNALFDTTLPDPREMCFKQGKAFVCMRDGDPDHIWSELPDGTVDRKRIDTRTVHGALPDERNKQVDLGRPFAFSRLRHRTKPARTPLDAGGDRRQRRRQEHLVSALCPSLAGPVLRPRPHRPEDRKLRTIPPISALRPKWSLTASAIVFGSAVPLGWSPPTRAEAVPGSSRPLVRKATPCRPCSSEQCSQKSISPACSTVSPRKPDTGFRFRRSAAGGPPAGTTWCGRQAASAASTCWTIPVAGGSRRANGWTGSWCASRRGPSRGRGTSLTGLRCVLQLPERGGYRPGHLARKGSRILSKSGNVDQMRC